ncbi:hypothetical protein [Amaricoccus sp.]|uniref:hypothetical protein n=1 Tax=Amaricoccus sp. TaxID=1872485 RepID=UPI001B3DF0EE|nr:hypothetical protein [Amaricoccus sp.]MBP7001566.1 hypothetical protein [Amaricoccus sp.]
MARDVPRAGRDALGRGLSRLEALGPVRRRAAIASLAWAVLVVAYAIGFFGASQARGTSFLDGAFFLVTLALPLILIWLAAYLAEELARQREMIAGLAELATPLFGALEATRAGLDRHAPASPSELRAAVDAALRAAGRPDPGPAIERLEAGLARVETRVETGLARLDAGLATLRAAPPAAAASPAPEPAAGPEPAAPAAAPPPGRRGKAAAPRETPPAATRQPALPLAAPAEPEEALGWGEMMQAFDFPRDPSDEEGFRALRRALQRRSLAQMLQAAEDLLTYLSQEGVYMDDLAMDPADPAAWRRFAAGGRGAPLDPLGGIRDESALEAARGLMKQDAVFRDAALFFLRRFDAVLGEIVADADDDAIAQLADTRSGRAFQLMARATGAFD